jgi:hypothetical protein
MTQGAYETFNLLTNYLTQRNRTFLDKITVAQVVKKFPSIFGTSILTCSQETENGPYSEPDEPSPRPHNFRMCSAHIFASNIFFVYLTALL